MRNKTLTAIGIAVAGLAAAVGVAQGQAPRFGVPQPLGRVCLHEAGETWVERQRRDDALAAVHLTDRLVDVTRSDNRRFSGRVGPYPAWSDLAAAGVRLGRMDGGPMGRLARKVQWGTREPLPGWQVHYVASDDGYAVSLTDTRDPCGWTYFGDERGAVAQGYLVDAPTGVVPVDSQ